MSVSRYHKKTQPQPLCKMYKLYSQNTTGTRPELHWNNQPSKQHEYRWDKPKKAKTNSSFTDPPSLSRQKNDNASYGALPNRQATNCFTVTLQVLLGCCRNTLALLY